MQTDLGGGRELAPAKVNLTLHVTGRRPDGYHMLDSVVVFPAIGDVVSVEASRRLSLSLGGPFSMGLAADEDNLVLRAAAAHLGAREGAALRLEKFLPVASGIGGGSADAAATLRALSRLTGRPVPDHTAALGADVPVCMIPRAARMRGIGDEITPLHGMPRGWMVLANAGQPLPTAEVFRALPQALNPRGPDWPEGGFADMRALAAWLRDQRNDLEAPATGICAPIAALRDDLGGQDDCHLARMSGSGGTVFGLFSDEAAALAATEGLRTRHPGAWIAAGPLTS